MATIINASTSNGLIQSADTSGTLQLQSNGTTKFTVDSTGAYGQLQSATAQASTSGTSIDFTGIPSWAKRITVMLNGVSTTGTSQMQVQIGAGSVTTSGYLSVGGNFSIAGGVGGSSGTAGFVTSDNSASAVRHGQMVITNITGNTWVSSHAIGSTGINFVSVGGGSLALGGTLDRIRITTVNGTDTFDAGSINILYE